MLPTSLNNGLKAYSNSGQSQIAPSNDLTTAKSKFEPGQQFQGSVISKITDGLFNVQVAGQTIQMRLPNNIRNGDAIKLEVVATRPKTVFNLIPTTNPLSNTEQISATAKILSSLAELPAETQTVRQLGGKAVWQTAQQPPEVEQLALALREELGKSGLFYESHQAQWVRGERSISQLLNEPQNVLTENKRYTTPSNQQTTSDTSVENVAMTDKSTGLPVTKELLNLVQQQLNTLEHHQLTWMGQIWPEQNMQWEIQGEQGHQAAHENERQWSTDLQLDLPSLGDIQAHLIFTANGLRLTLLAADTKTKSLFNQALPQLKNSLADANITLISALVENK